MRISEGDIMIAQTNPSNFELISELTSRFPAVHAFWRDDSGQDLVEWALLAAMLGMLAIASLQGLSTQIVSMYVGILATFNGAV